MDRQEINQAIIEILDHGDRDCKRTGDNLAFLLNKLVYMHNVEMGGIRDAKLPRGILVQFCAFRVPQNLFTMIASYLEE